MVSRQNQHVIFHSGRSQDLTKSERRLLLERGLIRRCEHDCDYTVDDAETGTGQHVTVYHIGSHKADWAQWKHVDEALALLRPDRT